MREIKFRGKRLDNGEWVYGQLLHFKSTVDNCDLTVIVESAEWTTNNEWFNLGKNAKVAPETVGQFTGLVDKNGKEIYEGDIVRVIYTQFEEDTIHEIKYFADDYSYPGFDLEPCIDYAESNSFQYANLIYALEVIGNIHDNPELLKEKQ